MFSIKILRHTNSEYSAFEVAFVVPENESITVQFDLSYDDVMIKVLSYLCQLDRQDAYDGIYQRPNLETI